MTSCGKNHPSGSCPGEDLHPSLPDAACSVSSPAWEPLPTSLSLQQLPGHRQGQDRAQQANPRAAGAILLLPDLIPTKSQEELTERTCTPNPDPSCRAARGNRLCSAPLCHSHSRRRAILCLQSTHPETLHISHSRILTVLKPLINCN